MHTYDVTIISKIRKKSAFVKINYMQISGWKSRILEFDFNSFNINSFNHFLKFQQCHTFILQFVVFW